MDTQTSPVPRKAPTLYDVATLAGVSHQTVSRLVKGHTNIRPEIRERVEAAIATLHYRPNLAARSLATAKSRRIGALFFDRFDEVGPTRSLQAASDRAREAGYLVDIVGLDPRDEDDIQRAISVIEQANVAGVIVFAPTESVRNAITQTEFPVPVYIEFETIAPAEQLSANVAGTVEVVEHLLALGHRRFFTITGPLDWFAAKARLDAYQSTLDAAGAVSLGMAEGNWGSESGFDAGFAMPLDRGITALVVANDQMALGALKALERRGVRVPDDLSVVGFDDIPESRFFKPSLTTVGLDFDRQGRMAMNHLLSMIEPDLARPHEEPLSAVLRSRDSSASARAASQITNR